MRAILSSRAAHRREAKKRRRHDEESDRGPQDVSSHPFLSCRYQLNVFASLSELMLDLLTISLAPGVPTSLKNIPEKYNIIIRLGTNCFYRLLENLRRSSPTSKIALEYLQEFIYYAYMFYTSLFERNTFKEYRAGWLEALGDLARYHIPLRPFATQLPPPETDPDSDPKVV